MKVPRLKNKEKQKRAGIKTSFTTRSFRVGGYSVIAAVIVLAIAVAANILVEALPANITQLDVTSDQRFSISEQTEKVLADLEEDINIYWIVQAGYEEKNLENLLERYTSMSSKLSVEKRDPDVYPAFVQQYAPDEVYNNSLVVEAGNRWRYVDYFTIYEYDYASYYTTGTTEVSFAGESALTSAISYVVSEDLPKLYTLAGHGESNLPAAFQTAVDKQNIETESLSLLTVPAVPEDADGIFICTPRSDITSDEKEQLLDYLRNGGNLFLITDPPRNETLTNLEALMAEYGVFAEEGIVIEGDANHYVQNESFALLPELGTHAITDPLRESGYYVLLPVAQGLTVSKDLPDDVSVMELLTTSDAAFSKVAGYSLSTYEKEAGDIDGPFALGIAATQTLDGGKEAKIVWVSSAALLNEQYSAKVSGGNQDFFLNTLGWICEYEESISIHTKSLAYEYLTIDSGTSAVLTLLFIAVLPLAYLAVGIYMWIRRKRR